MSPVRAGLLLALSAALPARAAEPHFAPLEFLLGHCWRAPFPNKMSDVQCYEPLYGGKLVKNTHVVVGSEPRYEGSTIFSFDPDARRLRFHYFTSTGAVSEGHLEPAEQGYVIPERHVGSDGTVTELRSDFRAEDAFTYTVVTRQKKGEDWVEVGTRRYRRTDAPGEVAVSAALSLPDGEWRLVWNSNRDGDWDAHRQELGGGDRRLTPPGSDEWAWSARGDTLIALSNAIGEGEAKGWRAHRMRSDGGGSKRLAATVVADGFADCHPSGAPCLAEVRIDGRKRIARLEADADAVPLDLGDGEAADPQFLPDGRQLLFRSNRSGVWELWLGDADGGNARKLTSDDGNDDVAAHEYGGEGPARFSPDGKHIVWMRKFPERGFDVWRMAVDGSEQRNLTADHVGDDAYPAWSPDGRWIAFDSNREGDDNEIYLMDADGSNVRRVTWSPGTDLAPLWVRLSDETWR